MKYILLLVLLVLLVLLLICNKYELFQNENEIINIKSPSTRNKSQNNNNNYKNQIIKKDSDADGYGYNEQINKLDTKCDELINNISLLNSKNKTNFEQLDKLNTNIMSNKKYNINNNLQINDISNYFMKIQDSIEKLNYAKYKN